MAFQRLALLLLLSLTGAAHAGELEAYAGANLTTYDATSEANTWGISLNAQYNFSREDNTWLVNLYAPGISLLAGQLSAGYLWRSHGDFYWEGGLAAGYSAIFGPSATLIGGFGYHVTPKFFVDFPLFYGTALVYWSPYLGWEF